MPRIYPKNDEQFVQWLTSFINVATEYQGDVRLSDDELEEMTALRNGMQSAIENEDRTRAAAVAATATKNERRTITNRRTSFRVKTILANPDIPAFIKENLGLNVPKPRSSTPPRPPMNAVATTTRRGTTVLTWEPNGNVGRVQYIVEQKTAQNGDWAMVGTTTTRTFRHSGQTPGQHALYRVRAQKAKRISEESNTATVFADAPFPFER